MRAPVILQKKQRNDLLLTLLLLFVLPLYYYGLRVLLMLVIAAATAILIELFYQKVLLRKKRFSMDATPLITSMICTLLLSAAAPFYVLITAIAFALLVAKYPFGGTGRNLFNPAAAGLCFVGLCWPAQVFSYPAPLTSVPILQGQFQNAASIEEQVRMGSFPMLSGMDIALGKFAGPLGASVAVILVACFVYLAIRRTISIYAPVATIVTASLLLLIFPKGNSGDFYAFLLELIAGVFLFGMVFMETDPSSTPRTRVGQLLFGVLLGFFAWVFKLYSVNDYNFLYALLLCNAFVPACDNFSHYIVTKFSVSRKGGDSLAK